LSVGIVWFRQDLRLADNPALRAAIESCDEILPVFIQDHREGSVGQIGEATQVWLHHSLASLKTSLNKAGSYLHLVQGDPKRSK